MAVSLAEASPGTRLANLKVVLACASAFLLISAAYLSYTIFERYDRLQKLSGYDMAFTVSQAVNEYLRFRERLAAVQLGTNDEDELQLRFEILVNRSDILRNGDAAAFINADPERLRVIEDFRAIIGRLEPLMLRVSEPGVAAEASAILAPLESEIVGLASEANQYGALKLHDDQRYLIQDHRNFSFLAWGLVLGGVAFIAMLLWHNRLLRQTQASLSTANQDLKRAMRDLGKANIAVLNANEELQTQNHLFDTALNNMSQGLCMFGPDERLIVSNQRFASMFGLDAAALVPSVTTMREISAQTVVSGSCEGESAAKVYKEHKDLIERGKPALFLQELIDGRVISISHQPMGDAGWVATYEDITDRFRAEARIVRMARHDVLTGLPNRLLFRERMEDALQRARQDGTRISVMCLDLDGFKNVNDTLGHPLGDALLREVAARASAVIRASDTVARLGGDEFVIIQEQITEAEEASRLARRLLDAVGKPYRLDGHQLVIGASIGIALAPDDGDAPDALLKSADMALYRAKSEGRGMFRFFERNMETRLQRRHAIEVGMRAADFDLDFGCFFQPIVDLRRNEISAFEALLRWTQPSAPATSPMEFIPVAEDTGLIVPLGDWVLRKACAEAARWPLPLDVSVNLSPAQFTRGDVLQSVRNALRESGLPPRRLILEITENVLMQDNESISGVLAKLREMNVRISLDDFGSGYSSLNYIRKFSVDTLKIDKSFVHAIDSDAHNEAIVSAIVTLGAALRMGTVAEGVETQAQLDAVRKAGCAQAQGYFFSRPRSAQDTHRSLLRNGNRPLAALQAA